MTESLGGMHVLYNGNIVKTSATALALSIDSNAFAPTESVFAVEKDTPDKEKLHKIRIIDSDMNEFIHASTPGIILNNGVAYDAATIMERNE